MITLAKTLCAWRDSFKATSGDATLALTTFFYDPAVFTLDFFPRAGLSVRTPGGIHTSFAVVPWEATELVQIPVNDQTADAFDATIKALTYRLHDRIYVTDACRIWSCYLAGSPEYALSGTAREALLSWHGTASWEIS